MAKTKMVMLKIFGKNSIPSFDSILLSELALQLEKEDGLSILDRPLLEYSLLAGIIKRFPITFLATDYNYSTG